MNRFHSTSPKAMLAAGLGPVAFFDRGECDPADRWPVHGTFSLLVIVAPLVFRLLLSWESTQFTWASLWL